MTAPEPDAAQPVSIRAVLTELRNLSEDDGSLGLEVVRRHLESEPWMHRLRRSWNKQNLRDWFCVWHPTGGCFLSEVHRWDAVAQPRAYGLVWPILGRLGRLDPSSNLGTPTITGKHDAVHP